MKPGHHAAVSIVLSGILYSIFRSWGLAVASFISGIFVDLDHIIDYWIEHGLRFDPKQFFNYFDEKNFENRKKLFFVFHGWEWLIALLMSAMLTDWNFWVTGLLVGYGQHMILDELYNSSNYRIRPYVWGYFLLWRWNNGFEFKTFYSNTENSDKNNNQMH
ncbi:MAG: hypothetical protein HZB30_09015 [Nitrospirae bacterium]|nr:hypothetical protein [Nitrospirota bacterium]